MNKGHLPVPGRGQIRKEVIKYYENTQLRSIIIIIICNTRLPACFYQKRLTKIKPLVLNMAFFNMNKPLIHVFI